MKAGATYEQYLLGTSFARPIIAKRIVDIALKEGADAICHGCTGKGATIRFVSRLAIHAFAPQMDIIAPWRFWELNSREKEIEYAGSTQHSAEDQQGRPTTPRIRTCGTSAMRVWTSSCRPTKHRSTSRVSLELGVSPEMAPDKPTYVTIHFEKGVPTAVDGEKLESVALIEKLNKLGGENGIGILDIVENRLVGMKSRGVYETPGGAILYAAHAKLEEITLDKGNLALQESGCSQVRRAGFTMASGTRRFARRSLHLLTPPRKPLPAMLS